MAGSLLLLTSWSYHDGPASRGSNELFLVLPHSNAMPPTQDLTSNPVTYKHMAGLLSVNAEWFNPL